MLETVPSTLGERHSGGLCQSGNVYKMFQWIICTATTCLGSQATVGPTAENAEIHNHNNGYLPYYT